MTLDILPKLPNPRIELNQPLTTQEEPDETYYVTLAFIVGSPSLEYCFIADGSFDMALGDWDMSLRQLKRYDEVIFEDEPIDTLFDGSVRACLPRNVKITEILETPVTKWSWM